MARITPSCCVVNAVLSSAGGTALTAAGFPASPRRFFATRFSLTPDYDNQDRPGPTTTSAPDPDEGVLYESFHYPYWRRFVILGVSTPKPDQPRVRSSADRVSENCDRT